MRLTKKKAIELSIELWEFMAETGAEDKGEWPGWEKYGEVQDDCFLCEYSIQRSGEHDCKYCPLKATYDGCYSTAYEDWEDATNKRERKKFGRLFLGQLRGLLK